MRILIINVNSHTGSTGKITKGLYDFLSSNGHKVKVCYRGALEKRLCNKDFIPLGNLLSLCLAVFWARLTGLEGHFNFIATKKVIKIIKTFEPDVVQLYNIHGNYVNSYKLLSFLKECNIPVVYSMLDEFAYMGKCTYPLDCEKYKTECNICPRIKDNPESWLFDVSNKLFKKKKQIYDSFSRIVFTGPNFVYKRAKESTLLRDKNVLELEEPFNFESFYPQNADKLMEKLGIKKTDKVVVCASGMEPRKGGHIFVEVAKRLRNRTDIKLIFIGYDKKRNWKFSENVIVKGFIPDPKEFSEYMCLADSYVCTSMGDTTPSVCLCALGCGTPIIAFDYGGVKDCAPSDYGTYVPLGNIEMMAKAVGETVKKTPEKILDISEYARHRFSSKAIYAKQIKLYYKLLTDN